MTQDDTRRHGKAREDTTRHKKIWQGTRRHNKAREGTARHEKAREGTGHEGVECFQLKCHRYILGFILRNSFICASKEKQLH